MVFFAILLGCRMSDPTTFVDELRVLAIRSNPAEISILDLSNISSPSEIPTADIWIANPNQDIIDILVWPCTNLGEGCLEQDFFLQNPTDSIALYENVNTEIQIPLPISPIAIGITSELEEELQPFGGTQMYVLACKQGTCPIIESWKQEIYDIEGISNPFEIMENLPIQEASLSFRSIYYSTRQAENRIQHPTLSFDFSGIPNLLLDSSVKLSCQYTLQNEPTDTSRIYAYTTLGGFPSNDDAANAIIQTSGTIDLLWFAPLSDNWTPPQATSFPPPVIDDGNIYIFLEDGQGGIGVLTENVYLLDSSNP